jgi:hypothetical protein
MFCRECGAQVAESAAICMKCGVRTSSPASSRVDGDPAMLQWMLPVGRSGYAVAAGYLGLLSLLVVPAPLALLFGILAIKDIERNPERLGKGRAIFGIVMGVLGTGILVWQAIAAM